jgi:aminopeptidase C
MDCQDRIVRHYLQAAHNRGGGWEMAMRMMAYNLMAAREGKPEKVSDLDTEKKGET